MNNRILQVNVIPVEDDFIHLSSKLLRELNIPKMYNHSVCLKVTILDRKLEDFYASYSQTPFNSNGDNAFNISYELLSTMRLKISENVLITPIDHIFTLKYINVTPVTNDDWELLMLNNSSLQDNILQQIRIINKNQIVPIWVSKFVHLKVCVDDLDGDMQFGLLKEFTEIIVNSNIMASDKNFNKKNEVKNLDNVKTELKYQDNVIPITKYYHKFICRTIILDEALVKFSHIYPYCAFISKLHMSMLYKNYSSNITGFVKISPIQELDKINDKKNQNKSLILRLCPLDPSMNNIEKMEIITWPTVYVTNILCKIMNLKLNSKVTLKPLGTIDNDICDIKNIYVSTIKKMNINEGEMLMDCLLNQLKNEIIHQKVLVLNNYSLLKVVYNKILTIDVLVIFSKSNVPYIFLNEYNFGYIKFINKFDDNILDNHKNLLEEIKQTKINNYLTFDTSVLGNYDLKCFKEISKFGSLCLKIGLNRYKTQSQSFFDHDNLLIIGSVASGKTISAKLLCKKFSKCPYFVKIIWINGRSYAGKLWETFQKQLINYFQECLYYQPAIIVIDDLDELCHLNNEPNEQPDMFKINLRPLYLLIRIIEYYTNNKYCIRVICTSKPMNEENEEFIMKQLTCIFKTVLHIPIIDKENRKIIISKRLKNVKFDKDINDKLLSNICEKMNNYVIQDLIDFCDKVLFETIKSNSVLNKTILNNVFENNIPLSLHNVKICKEKKFNFSLIGGMNNVKQIITETIIWPSVYPDVFSKCPLKLESGVLLYGAPGTGKTLLARSVIGESNLNFISVNGPELLSKYVGESENNLRKIFQKAQNAKPCIIFFDEFDSITSKRGSEQTGVTDRIVNQFLTQLDGVSAFDGVWVIAATSRPDIIDKALLRPGRIGVKLHCELPNAKDREDILKIICKKVTLSTDVNLHTISALTMNYTGADLNGLLYTAITIAEKKLLREEYDSLSSEQDNILRKPIITADDFQNALKMTIPSLTQTDIDRYAQIHTIFSHKKMVDQNVQVADFDDNISGGSREKQQKLTFAS